MQPYSCAKSTKIMQAHGAYDRYSHIVKELWTPEKTSHCCDTRKTVLRHPIKQGVSETWLDTQKVCKPARDPERRARKSSMIFAETWSFAQIVQCRVCRDRTCCCDTTATLQMRSFPHMRFLSRRKGSAQLQLTAAARACVSPIACVYSIHQRLAMTESELKILQKDVETSQCWRHREADVGARRIGRHT